MQFLPYNSYNKKCLAASWTKWTWIWATTILSVHCEKWWKKNQNNSLKEQCFLHCMGMVVAIYAMMNACQQYLLYLGYPLFTIFCTLVDKSHSKISKICNVLFNKLKLPRPKQITGTLAVMNKNKNQKVKLCNFLNSDLKPLKFTELRTNTLK